MSHSIKRHRKAGGYYPQASDTEIDEAFGGTDQGSLSHPHEDREGDWMTELKDIAGNVIEPGDTVIYPQMSGRSVQMVLGKLVSYNGKTAQIERSGGSRWGAGYSGTKYRDKRTGKNIDIWAASGKHWETQAHYTYKHRETGEEITEAELNARFPVPRYTYYRTPAEKESGRKRGEYERVYHRGVLKDYVEKYEAPLPSVTIYNVSNIVKVSVVPA